ncbi:17818_t:CDS:2, partial [Racocetra persica]
LVGAFSGYFIFYAGGWFIHDHFDAEAICLRMNPKTRLDLLICEYNLLSAMLTAVTASLLSDFLIWGLFGFIFYIFKDMPVDMPDSINNVDSPSY